MPETNTDQPPGDLAGANEQPPRTRSRVRRRIRGLAREVVVHTTANILGSLAVMALIAVVALLL